MKISKSLKNILTIENVVGVFLAILLTFDLKLEEDLRQFMNSLSGMISCLIILVLMFVYLNPLVALLFLVYFYENVRHDNLLSGMYDKYTNKNVLSALKKTNDLNQKTNDMVEIETIKKMAPIVQKTERTTSFKPNTYTKVAYRSI